MSRLFFSLAALILAFILSVAQFVPADNYGLVKTNIALTYDHTFGPVSDHFRARESYEFLRTHGFTLTANGHFNTLRSDFDADDIEYPALPADMGMNGTHLYGQVGLSATYRTMLWNKPLVTMGVVSVDFGNRRFQRVSGMAMALIMLRANRTTQFGIGPLVLINTTSRIPAFPVFILRHRFNRLLSLNFYGMMYGLDITPTANDLFTVGGDIDVRAFYFSPDRPDLPRHCRYNSTSLRPSVKYRRCILPRFYGELQGGVAIKMSSRVNGATGSHRYFEVRQSPHPFLQASLTYSL